MNKAAESPEDKDFENAAVYRISNLPAAGERESVLLKINYRGDVARLYCDGKLIADNFYNGRPMLMGLWRLPEDATELELRILRCKRTCRYISRKKPTPLREKRLSEWN